MEKIKRWFDNFWEYNKWKVLVSIVTLAILSITLPTIINRKSPDFSILYVGPNKVLSTLNKDAARSTSEFLRDDYNGDGEINADFVTLLISSATVPKVDEEGNPISDESMIYIAYGDELFNQFHTEISVGNSVIYIVNPIFYNWLKNENYLVSLDKVLGYMPEDAIDDGLGISYASIDASNLGGFSTMRHNMILCLRYKRPDEDSDSYNSNIEFLKDFLEFKIS